MLISIGAVIRDGPWGGGNQVARALSDYLHDKGVGVCHDLTHPDIDIILLFDPRKNSQTASYQVREIFSYLSKSPQTMVVHRINECDERKNTKGVNRSIARANYCADHTVFVSSWLRELYAPLRLPCKAQSVILNGSDKEIFNQSGIHKKKGLEKLRIVTHHWGTHTNKGFDVYAMLDAMIGNELKGKIEFTYIGNLPPGFHLKNSTYVPPLHGHALATKLKESDVYLTASRFEPGPNHQNEGANCGLPVLYLDNGPMKEYCDGYGLSYEKETLFEKINEMISRYHEFSVSMVKYPHTSGSMCNAYYKLFCDLVKKKDECLQRRQMFRKFHWYIKRFIP